MEVNKMKKLMSMMLAVVMVLSTIVARVNADSYDFKKVNPDNMTLVEVERELVNYLRQAKPDIVVGSKEYVEYMSEYLLEEHDRELEDTVYYDEILIYMNEYLAEVCNPNRFIEKEITVNGDRITVLEMTEEEKNRTIKDIKLEVEALEKKEAEDIKNYENVVSLDSGITDVELERLENKYTDTRSYNKNKAVEYALDFAETRNPVYKDFPSDCTNFVSQCVRAGGRQMDSDYSGHGSGYKSSTRRWYHKQNFKLTYYPVHYWTTAFTVVEDFYEYSKKNGAYTINCGKGRNRLQRVAKKGDIVQIKKTNGKWFHSIIITGGEKYNWKYSSHTDDWKNRKVSKLSSDYSFRIIRF